MSPNAAIDPQAETDRLVRRLSDEDLPDAAEIATGHFNRGWNALAELLARMADHDGNTSRAALLRRLRK